MSTGDLAINCTNGDNLEGMLKLLIRNAVDCSEYVTCDNKDDSWKSILKRLIVEDPDGNLAINVCGCSCEGEGGGGVLSITYDELQTLIATNGLVAGQLYLLTDYQTVHYFLDAGSAIPEINTGNIEPLLLMATSTNTLSPQAISIDYPNDDIYYDWDSNNYLTDVSFSDGAIIAGWKGVIIERHDKIKNLRTGYDFRAVKFRRWAIVPDAWNNATPYIEGGYVVKSNVLYQCILANTNKDPAVNAQYWVSLLNVTTAKYLSANSTWFCLIPVDANDYADYYTFEANCSGITSSPSSLTLTGLPTRLNNLVFLDYARDIELKVDCYNLTIGGYGYAMSFGHLCHDIFTDASALNIMMGDGGNQIIIGANAQDIILGHEPTLINIASGAGKIQAGNYFFDSIIGGANAITLGNYCERIRIGFGNSITLGNLNNLIYMGFATGITIGEYSNAINFNGTCSYMSIGNGCSTIDIATDCNGFSIGNQCSGITISNNCAAIIIDDNSSGIDIGNYAVGINIGSYCSVISIGDGPGNITIGSYGSNLTFGDSCSCITIMNYVSSFTLPASTIKLIIEDCVSGCSVDDVNVAGAFNKTITNNANGDLIVHWFDALNVLQVAAVDCEQA